MRLTSSRDLSCNRALALAVGFLLASHGHAADPPDKDSNVPTGWLWSVGTNSAQVTTWRNQGFRVIESSRRGSDLYDVILVSNTGVYQRSVAGWYGNSTAAALSTTLTNFGQRLVGLDGSDNGSGGHSMTGVAIHNSGADSATWGWLWGTDSTTVNSWVTGNNVRLVDLRRYTVGSNAYYVAAGVTNSGTNARGWWYSYGRTASQISTMLSTNNAFLVSLRVNSVGTVSNPTVTYDVIMYQNQGQGWWWYPELTSIAQIADRCDLNAARLTNLERYVNALGQVRYAVVMMKNSNALTDSVRSVILSGLSSSAVGGGYMKEVGGPEHCAIGADYIFEPASMLKILYGAYAIDQCAANLDNITNNVFVGDRCNNDECPDGVNCNPGSETLSAAIREMLEESDNNRTKVIHDRYGRATLNAYAQALGMTRTQINHDIGCGTPANQLTLRDAGRLYELIADGTLFSDFWQSVLYDLMIDETGLQGGFMNEINGQAGSVIISTSDLNAFKALAYRAVKGGSYTIGGVQHRATGGWMRLPFKSSCGTITQTEYAITSFVNNEPNATAAGNTNSAIWWTMARDRIRAALLSWSNAQTAPSISTHPTNRTVNLGGTAHFSAIVNGTNPTLRWFRGIQPLSNGPTLGGGTISGATTFSLTITGVHPSDAGIYRLRATNPCGEVTSNGATLTVICPTDVDDGSGLGIPDGGVSIDDLLYYLAIFDDGRPSADLDDGSGTGTRDGGVTIEDLLYFLIRFDAGC